MTLDGLRNNRSYWVWAGIFLLATSPALAGVVYEIEVADHDHSPPSLETVEMSVQGKNLVMDIAPGNKGGAGGKVIFRGDRGAHGEMIMVDDERRSYFVLDAETMRSLAGQVDSAMAQMDEALKNVPEGQRQAIEKMMKQRGLGGATASPPERPRSEVRKSTESATKNGYACAKYEVFLDDRKTRELWVTDWDNVEGGAEIRAAFAGFAQFFEEMIDSLPEMPGGMDPFSGAESMAENFKYGFPVISTGFDQGGGIEDEAVLRQSRRLTLDPAAFEPPAGYKRMSMGPQ